MIILGVELSSLSSDDDEMNVVTLLLQLYFNNVIVLQPKKGVADE